MTVSSGRADIRSVSDELIDACGFRMFELDEIARRRKPQAASLWEDGPGNDDEQDRSRATMWDVPRFAEAKLLKGKPYQAIIVENVVDAFRWGADDDGGLFAAWRLAMHNLGYRSEIVWLNSMFAWPTPQSRDRMYVVFWRKELTAPNLRIEPPSWCPGCERIVDGRQAWKRPDRPHETAQGKPVGARYGVQYLFTCPDCHGVVLPGVFPAATAIDWTVTAPRIGDRARPLATNTRERIRGGLARLMAEPFAIRLLQGGSPRPLTLPLVTLTQRHDVAMVIPIAGNTFERTPGNRARDAATQPHDTLCGSEGPRLAIVGLQRNGDVRDAELDPSHTMRAGGFHHGIIVRNNNSRGDSGAMCTPPQEPFRTLTAACHQSLVVPYGAVADARGAMSPAHTVMTRNRLALVVPPSTDSMPRDAHAEPSFVQTTETRPSLLEVPE